MDTVWKLAECGSMPFRVKADGGWKRVIGEMEAYEVRDRGSVDG